MDATPRVNFLQETPRVDLLQYLLAVLQTDAITQGDHAIAGAYQRIRHRMENNPELESLDDIIPVPKRRKRDPFNLPQEWQ